MRKEFNKEGIERVYEGVCLRLFEVYWRIHCLLVLSRVGIQVGVF